MTTLAIPPTWPQFSGPGAGNNSCGAHAVASGLVAAGLLALDSGLADVEGLIGVGETSAQQLVTALEHFGATDPQQIGLAEIGATLAAGRYVIPLIQSDGLGNPVALGSTDIDHWVCQYSDTPIWVANSGSGRDEEYGAGSWASCQAGTWIDTGCTQPKEGNGTMDPQDVARLVVYAMVTLGLAEGPATPGVANQIESYVRGIVGNPEGGLSALITDLQANPSYLWKVMARAPGSPS